MIADLVDIHTNNKIGVPKYFKQSYVNTSSYRRNSSGNGFRYPAKLNQGSVNQIKHRTSYSVGNSPVRCLNKNTRSQASGIYHIQFKDTSSDKKNGSDYIARIWKCKCRDRCPCEALPHSSVRPAFNGRL